jgi:hypothetical protein
MEGGLVIIGWVFMSTLCRLEGLKPAECKPLHPIRIATRDECLSMKDNAEHDFPKMQAEQFGFPKGTRLHITMNCRPLYGDRTA